ncbi:MAG: hypothetical protein JSR55_09715 [Proteobacteria bacterium]|nr:hypothetical protein [Pseudomonadota bacterium]
MTAQIYYLIASLAGVAALVGLCALLFGREVAKLDTRAAAARMGCEVPGFRPGHSALSADCRSAMLEDARDGSVWLVAARGDGFVTRRLSRRDVKAVSRKGAALALRFSDFTFPAAVIAFHDEDAARDWEMRMGKA